MGELFFLRIVSVSINGTYHRVCNKSSKTGATNGAGTAYPSGAPEFTDF
jgi:hypothetical protein